MFQVIETTRRYNRRGDVIASSDRVVFETADPIAATRFRYSVAPKCGHFVSLDNVRGVTLSTVQDGERVTFADVFRIVEGDEAYHAVIEDRAPPVAEATWIASKAA
jgi:hypothetical protein